MTNDQNISVNEKRNAHANILHAGWIFSCFLSLNRDLCKNLMSFEAGGVVLFVKTGY